MKGGEEALNHEEVGDEVGHYGHIFLRFDTYLQLFDICRIHDYDICRANDGTCQPDYIYHKEHIYH